MTLKITLKYLNTVFYSSPFTVDIKDECALAEIYEQKLNRYVYTVEDPAISFVIPNFKSSNNLCTNFTF
jgi:hypothetical protein